MIIYGLCKQHNRGKSFLCCCQCVSDSDQLISLWPLLGWIIRLLISASTGGASFAMLTLIPGHFSGENRQRSPCESPQATARPAFIKCTCY